MNGAGAGFVTKIPHLVHLRGHALQQCSMAVFNPQFQRTRYQGRHGSNSSSCNMNIQDALDLHLKEEAFRIIGKSKTHLRVLPQLGALEVAAVDTHRVCTKQAAIGALCTSWLTTWSRGAMPKGICNKTRKG